jgi:hypothetical protein
MSLLSLMQQHCSAEATSGDFTAVAAKLNANSVVVHDGQPVSMARTLAALIAAGIDPDPVIAVFETTPTGRSGLAKLADEGLDYGHPITAGLIAKMVSLKSLPQATANVLTGLSVHNQPVLGRLVTADECRDTWLEAARIASVATLDSRWVACLNDCGINSALARGDSQALITALEASVVRLKQ